LIYENKFTAHISRANIKSVHIPRWQPQNTKQIIIIIISKTFHQTFQNLGNITTAITVINYLMEIK